MKLYYSVDFKESIITHHGEISYPISAYQNYDKYTESMTAFVKADLTKSIKKWGYTADDMVAVEFYFYRGSEEVIFFSWEKEDLIENK
ncbi:MAG TPA: hypothetical protein VLZ83_16035 [Edaphocola sp.]|nr:hypothetical protein [Edaphocola sp.]